MIDLWELTHSSNRKVERLVRTKNLELQSLAEATDLGAEEFEVKLARFLRGQNPPGD